MIIKFNNNENKMLPVEYDVNNSKKLLRKKFGIITYIKHSLMGCLIAVVSFSTALAAQPHISDGEYTKKDYSYEMIYDATETDLEILIPYMDENIISNIIRKESEPSVIIEKYLEEDNAFISIVEDYFAH